MRTNLKKGYILTEDEINFLEDISARLYINSCVEHLSEETKFYIYYLNEVVDHMKEYYADQIYKDMKYLEKLQVNRNEMIGG